MSFFSCVLRGNTSLYEIGAVAFFLRVVMGLRLEEVGLSFALKSLKEQRVGSKQLMAGEWKREESLFCTLPYARGLAS